MARDKAKHQAPPALWPEGKGAATSVQILLLHLIWKPSAEADGARIRRNVGRRNKSAILSFCLVQTH